jgi:hypothetical protein
MKEPTAFRRPMRQLTPGQVNTLAKLRAYSEIRNFSTFRRVYGRRAFDSAIVTDPVETCAHTVVRHAVDQQNVSISSRALNLVVTKPKQSAITS